MSGNYYAACNPGFFLTKSLRKKRFSDFLAQRNASLARLCLRRIECEVTLLIRLTVKYQRMVDMDLTSDKVDVGPF